MRSEQKSDRSQIRRILDYIESVGKLREPQKEAIECYLWIKFVGENKKLSDMVRAGLLCDEQVARAYEGSRAFEGNHVGQFLNQFFIDNNLSDIRQDLLADPRGEETDWQGVLRELLHNYDYPNYLFSLPMGAGKTYLMASFIYLDLYFARQFPDDRRFAHNFVVFAPSASKTAILPSLRTIEDFNPAWILPEKKASELRRMIAIEILDSLGSKRKDKLHSSNPNLEKVNRARQTKDMGLVFITNAEKVVLERYKDEDREMLKSLRVGQSDLYDSRTAGEIEKTNALREGLSEIRQLGIILDEVHHAYGNKGEGEKKLRKAVSILNRHKNLTLVLGLSGTPYARSKMDINGADVSLNQIQDVVYHYPLNQGIGKFLKKAKVEEKPLDMAEFIAGALDEFFSDYDRTYDNGTKSKIAIYCPKIRSLNEDILPAVQRWYQRHRPGTIDREVLRYYGEPTKEDRQYRLPVENLAAFNNLDTPESRVRVVLLVAVGKEGWDCRSLTAVALPRQKTGQNFVLQTTCRCLREVCNAAGEEALIYLSPDNYKTLDEELQRSQRLSVSELDYRPRLDIKVQVRKPKLGTLRYKQIETTYKIVKSSQKKPDARKVFREFEFDAIRQRYPFEPRGETARIGKAGLTKKTTVSVETRAGSDPPTFAGFIYQLAISTFGHISESELLGHKESLKTIHHSLCENWPWLDNHPDIDLTTVCQDIVADLMGTVEIRSDSIEKLARIELLEWRDTDNYIPWQSPTGVVYKMMPRTRWGEEDLDIYKNFARYPENMEKEFFSDDNNVDPHNISYNYAPWRMDSAFEQRALECILKLSEMKGLEIYFNGYTHANLQSFWIQTPRGRYTPDFLILRRKQGKTYTKARRQSAIEKVLIIETKGKIHYEEFRARERFLNDTFVKHNPHFLFHCFVGDGDSKFDSAERIGRLRELLTELRK